MGVALLPLLTSNSLSLSLTACLSHYSAFGPTPATPHPGMWGTVPSHTCICLRSNNLASTPPRARVLPRLTFATSRKLYAGKPALMAHVAPKVQRPMMKQVPSAPGPETFLPLREGQGNKVCMVWLPGQLPWLGTPNKEGPKPCPTHFSPDSGPSALLHPLLQ